MTSKYILLDPDHRLQFKGKRLKYLVTSNSKMKQYHENVKSSEHKFVTGNRDDN